MEINPAFSVVSATGQAKVPAKSFCLLLFNLLVLFCLFRVKKMGPFWGPVLLLKSYLLIFVVLARFDFDFE